jgi:hypothetical protein
MWGEVRWYLGLAGVWLSWHWHRHVLCRLGRHYRKFDTYPQRGMCIYCKARKEVTTWLGRRKFR